MSEVNKLETEDKPLVDLDGENEKKVEKEEIRKDDLEKVQGDCEIPGSEEKYSSSDNSDSEDIESHDAVVKFLEGFKLKKTEFFQENLAKAHGECMDLTPEQESFLKTLKDFLYAIYNGHECFMSVVQDINDIRSFRVLFGQKYGSLYDYSLICVDVYVHNFLHPTAFLRTGYPECNLSLYFKKNGLLRSPRMTNLEEYDSLKGYFEGFFMEIHSDIFMYGSQLDYFPKYRNSEIPNFETQALQNFLKYACVKYGIYEHLVSPMPEFKEAISAYFIINKYNLKFYLETNSVIEEMESTIPENSLAYQRNPKIMEIFKQSSYNTEQLSLYSKLNELLESLPNPKVAYNLDYGNSAPVCLKEGSFNDPQPPESISHYYSTLKTLRFNQYDFWSKKSHVLKANVIEGGAFNTNRLSKEIKVLSQHLPCEATGAIFVVMDSERMDLMKALISGSEDTPYSHGLYEFHIACPPEYPKKPPSVHIVTTGKGNVRFNPNLYDDGYVCLSVINTWDGDPSERWNPTHSNILQVLLSIQVLVMDNMIIQKEPDFEYLEVDSLDNKTYSSIVRYNNVKYAMLEMLKNPPEEFREVVNLHFALKRNSILETIDQWIEDSKNLLSPKQVQIDFLVKDHNPYTCNLFHTNSYYSLLVEARNELLILLDSLPDVGVPKKEFKKIEITDLSKLGKYFTQLNSFLVTELSFNEAGGYRHSLGQCVGSLKSYNLRETRFEQDLESLKQLKTLNVINMFVVYDEDRTDLLKVLVSGPVDTDYANGLFLFEVACPEQYPEEPPIARLVTNGRYSVVFHPQFKRNGEVLGLNWNPQMNLLDFLNQLKDVFKKPGWDLTKKENSVAIQYNTIKYAILDMIHHPPLEFKDVVSTHFQVKCNDCNLIIGKWMAEIESVDLNFDLADEVHSFTIGLFKEGQVYNMFQEIYDEIVETIGGDEKNDDGSADNIGLKAKKNKGKNCESDSEEYYEDEAKEDIEDAMEMNS